MTTRELYSSIGVSACKHEGCWRKDGIFHIRVEAPPSCHKCPKCGNREVIHRGTFTRIVRAAPIAARRQRSRRSQVGTDFRFETSIG